MKLEDLTILYAEDENGIQQKVSQVLELYVNNVITASDGEELLELYKQYKPSILLIDINMPNKDGLTALKEIRQEDINTPVIVMTAHTEKEYLMNAVELHITKYLVKPFNKKAVLEALDACINLLIQKNDSIIKLANNIEFTDELIELKQIEIAQKNKFLLKDHVMTIYGLCEDCQ